MRIFGRLNPSIQRAALPPLMGVLFAYLVVAARGGDDFGSESSDCAIPSNLFVSGGPGPDGILALTLPPMVTSDQVPYLSDSDRVLGVVVNGEARAYLHRIMWHQEIVNDRIGDKWVSVSFCPLTGSGIAMDATVAGNRIEFGVDGLLFSNNLVMFDRLTDELYRPQLAI